MKNIFNLVAIMMLSAELFNPIKAQTFSPGASTIKFVPVAFETDGPCITAEQWINIRNHVAANREQFIHAGKLIDHGNAHTVF
ncbi:MAG: hypothetical protein ACHQFW_09950, partial [Chitinophagales bacterium]